jgi:Bacterial PH domain
VDSWLRSVNDRVPGLPEPDTTEEPLDAEWSPSAGLVVLAWVGTVAAVAWCVLIAGTGDRAGLLLAVVAAAGLGLAAVYGTRARPRLRVDTSGVTVGGLAARRHHPWAQVGDVRVLTVRRLGRATRMLEIDVVDPDGGEHLMVFGRLDLDAEPDDVASVVQAIRRAIGGPR